MHLSEHSCTQRLEAVHQPHLHSFSSAFSARNLVETFLKDIHALFCASDKTSSKVELLLNSRI